MKNIYVMSALCYLMCEIDALNFDSNQPINDKVRPTF